MPLKRQNQCDNSAKPSGQPARRKQRAHSLNNDPEKKERTESLAQTLTFRAGRGNRDKQFSLLYVSEADEIRTFLLISGKDFAKEVKKDPSVTLEAFDNKAVTINTVIDLTQVSPASAGLYGGAADAKPSIGGMLAAAYEINQAVLQSRVEVGARGILVHCRSGLERSISSTLFYLMGHQDYPFKDAAQLLYDALEAGRGTRKVKKHNPAYGNDHHRTVQSLFEDVEVLSQGKKVRRAIEEANSLVTRKTTSENTVSVTSVQLPERSEALESLISNLKPAASTPSQGPRRSRRIRKQNMLTVAARAGRGQDYKQQEVEKTNEAEKIVKTATSSSSSDSVAVKPSRP